MMLVVPTQSLLTARVGKHSQVDKRKMNCLTNCSPFSKGLFATPNISIVNGHSAHNALFEPHKKATQLFNRFSHLPQEFK